MHRFQLAKTFMLSTMVLLSHAPLGAAQTMRQADHSPPRSSRSDESSRVQPLLQSAGHNQVVGIRCVQSQSTTQFESSRRLPPSRQVLHTRTYAPVTLTLQDCEAVWIYLHNAPFGSDRPVFLSDWPDSVEAQFDDSWLTRQGSGWYWLLNGQN